MSVDVASPGEYVNARVTQAGHTQECVLPLVLGSECRALLSWGVRTLWFVCVPPSTSVQTAWPAWAQGLTCSECLWLLSE